MHFVLLTLLSALCLQADSALSPLKTVETHNERIEGHYIVTLHRQSSKEAYLGWLTGRLDNDSSILHSQWDSKFFNGFGAKLSKESLRLIQAHPDVASISEDGVVRAYSTQTNAPWGLQRISQRAKLSRSDTSALDYTYTYGGTASGVDVYIVDTGIYTAHVDFGGRARWGATFGGSTNTDGNGHGTHIAGSVGGTRFGVAKSASLIAVKVLGDDGSGTTSNVISGLNYVATQARASGRPSVALLSLGGSASSAVDTAVTSLTSAGVHVVAAAGGSGTDAGNTSPGRVPSAITVGASNILDERAPFSSYGSVIDIFAPGVGIISDWIGSPNATNSLSGTSMSAAYIAGLTAYLISVGGNRTPADLSTYMKNLSTKNALSGIPAGTVNYLAYNGVV